MFDFAGKSVLVTGGSRGIGGAAALSFADRGARVAINFRADVKSGAIIDVNGASYLRS